MDSKQIFISHSSQDNEAARRIVELLQAYECNVWYDEQHMQPGRIRYTLEIALASSQVFLLLLSEAALTSYWVAREIDAAFTLEAENGMLIVPALIRPCTVPLLLSGYLRLDFINCPDPVFELKRFLTILEHIPAITTVPPQKSASQARSSQPVVQQSQSISNIKARTVNIKQGAQTFNFYGNSTQSIDVLDLIKLAELNDVMRDLNKILDSGQYPEVKCIELFIKTMYGIINQRKVLPLEVVTTATDLCKRLGIQSLL